MTFKYLERIQAESKESNRKSVRERETYLQT